jgi:hypothetical protein
MIKNLHEGIDDWAYSLESKERLNQLPIHPVMTPENGRQISSMAVVKSIKARIWYDCQLFHASVKSGSIPWM